MSYCDYRILSHISASSLAAALISALANIAPTTAIPAIPVPFSVTALSAFMPPIATTGISQPP